MKGSVQETKEETENSEHGSFYSRQPIEPALWKLLKSRQIAILANHNWFLENLGLASSDVLVDKRRRSCSSSYRLPIPAAPPVVSSSADELADMMLTRAFLGAVQIRSNERTARDQVIIRVEQLFETRSTIYIHYRVENNTDTLYHAGLPAVFELKPEHSSISLGSIVHTQLDSRGLKKLGTAKALPLVVGHVESELEQLEPGASTQGVVAIRQDLKSPAVLQLVFDSELKATFVF